MVYENLNKFKYEFKNRETGRTSSFTTFCYGNPFQQIQLYKNNLKEMCLKDVSNETHEIIKVTHLFNNKVIYEKEE